MRKNDYMDMLVGAPFSLLGVGVFVYSRFNYEMGNLSEMGPGFFPGVLGVVMAVLGCIVIASGVNTKRIKIELNKKPLFLITLSVILFALSIEKFGALLAVFTLVLVSSFSEKKINFNKKLILFLVLFLICYLTFKVGLGMNFRIIQGVF